MTTNSVLGKLAAAVESAIAGAGVTAVVRPYRANPIGGGGIEVMVSLLATTYPEASIGADIEDALHDFVVLLHVPYLKGTEAEMEQAEIDLNNIQDAVQADMRQWRNVFDATAYPWQRAFMFRPATRPPSPAELRQYRLGQIFIRIQL